jgi:hypothetical protein
MRLIISFILMVVCFFNAQAADVPLSAQQELLEDYNIALITDTCVDDGYEINIPFPCFGGNAVENFAKDVLRKIKEKSLRPSYYTLQLQLTKAWIFCINSNNVVDVSENNQLMAYKVQNCNLDKTLNEIQGLNQIEATR